jgi:hypothetical protein
VTEREWLTCADPERLLAWLHGRVGERKLRLFACACVRQVWDLVPAVGRQAVETAERYADGVASFVEMNQSGGSIARATMLTPPQALPRSVVAARRYGDASALTAAHPDPFVAAGLASRDAAFAAPDPTAARVAQADLLRCLLGNPFRPLPPPRRTLPPHVVGLARTFSDGDLALAGLLADALEEIDEADAADHLRASRHARGCHAVDWALGRT